jgi:UDP-N-acetylmuramoyl-tripeptide--D-alanyl-D-alanine ligase
MIPLSLKEVAANLGATLIGDDCIFTSVTTDSRKVEAGSLFVALMGDKFDGHQFCADVCHQGAKALLVSEVQAVDAPQLLVADTRYALGQLGALVRSRAKAKIVAITGSCGKTTVKEMCASILGQCGSVLATQGNLNNEIGVPLTLLRLTPEHDYAVLELGANHPGEIAWTTSLVKPDVAIINNVAAAHLEGFGTLQGVALAKSEIFNGLDERGIAIVNADSEFFGYWQSDLGASMVSFGLENSAADFVARDLRCDADALFHFTLVTPQGEIDVSLSLPGRHNIANALAAAALTQSLGINLSIIKHGLESMSPVKGRLCVSRLPCGLTLIDDTYNASVQSVLAAIDTLATMPGFRVMVFGDMGELGVEAVELHRQVGEHARACNLDLFMAVGPLSIHAAQAAGGRHFADKSALFAALEELLSQHSDITLLAKGARSSHMEEVIEFVKTRKEQTC